MADNAPKHPEKEQLLAFGMGKLGPGESEKIAQHLDDCRDCSETIVNLQDDTFVSLVRRSPAPAPVDDAELQPDPTVDVASGLTGDQQGAIAELPAELRDHPRYEILELIGRGGMGDVYKAQHKVMNRDVALKVIKTELVKNDAAVERFRREVQAAASLRHPNIVTAHDAEQAGDLHFLVMEYVDGENLDEVISREGRLPVDEACDYIRQAAEGLQHAHDLGMVHRDIKPHNLMVEQQTGTIVGSASTLKILDFGLANLANEAAEEALASAENQAAAGDDNPPEGASIVYQLTQMGTMMGTPNYIAPEQAQDAHAADIRADIYSLGCTFYTLLTGSAPFGEGSVLDKVKAHAHQEAPPLSDTRDDVPPEVDAVLQKMMAKDPAERYQTPAEVAEALSSVAASCQLAESAPIDRQAESSSPRNRWPRWAKVAAGFAALFLLGVVLYIVTDQGTLVVKSETDEVQLVIRKDPNGPQKVMDVSKGETRIRLGSGQYRIDVRGTTAEFSIAQSKVVVIHRGDEVPFPIEILGEPTPNKIQSPVPSQSEIAALLKDATLVMNFEKDTFGDSDSSVRDLSGNGNNGICLGRTTYRSDGKNGGALAVEGGGLRIERPLLPESETFTVAGWFKLDKPTGPAGKNVWNVYDERVDESVSDVELTIENEGNTGLGIKTRNRLARTVNGHSLMSFPDAGLPDYGQWFFAAWSHRVGHFLVTINDRTGDFASHELNLADFRKVGPRHAIIGRGLRGMIDDMVVFDRALSKDELKQLYEFGRAGHSLPALKGASNQIAEVRRFEGQTKRATGLRFTKDGMHVISSCGDGALRMWNVETGKLIRALDDPRIDSLSNVALSQDGRLAVTTVFRGTARIDVWDLQKGSIEHTIEAGDTALYGVAFLPGTSRFVVGAFDRPLQLYEAGTGKAIEKPIMVDRAISLAAAPDGKILVGTGDRLLHLVDVSSSEVVRTLDGHHGAAFAVAVSPDGTLAASASGQGSVALWNLNTGEPLGRLRGHTGKVEAVAFTPDGRHLLSGGWDHTLRVWNVVTRREVTRVTTQNRVSLELAVSPDGRRVLAGGGEWWDDRKKQWFRDGDYALRLWRLPESVWPKVGRIANPSGEKITEVRRFDGHPGHVQMIEFTADGKRLVSVGAGHIRAWDMETSQVVHKIDTGRLNTRTMALSPDGRRVATGGHDGTVAVWSLETGKQTLRFDKHNGRIEYMAWLPGGNQIVSKSWNGDTQVTQLWLWDAGTGEIVREFADARKSQSLAFSPDGRWLVAGSQVGQPLVWDVNAGQVVRMLTGHSSKVFAVAYSPDGKQILTGGEDGTARLWDAASGEQLKLLRHNAQKVGSVAFHPDGRYAITGSGSSLQLWDLETAKIVAHANNVPLGDKLSFALHPHGRLIATAPVNQHIDPQPPETPVEMTIQLWQLPESAFQLSVRKDENDSRSRVRPVGSKTSDPPVLAYVAFEIEVARGNVKQLVLFHDHALVTFKSPLKVVTPETAEFRVPLPASDKERSEVEAFLERHRVTVRVADN